MPGNQNYDDWQLLYTCTEEQEADMIESFLSAEKIVTLRKYPGFSDMSRIIGGMTKLGINIYVRESQFNEASMIVEDLTAGFSELKEDY